MANPDTSPEGIASEPGSELNTSQPTVDSATADLPVPPPISEVVDQTLDSVDRELASLEAALEGELESVTALSEESTPPESFLPESAVHQEDSDRELDPLPEAGDFANAEQALEEIASSMTTDAVEPDAAGSPDTKEASDSKNSEAVAVAMSDSLPPSTVTEAAGSTPGASSANASSPRPPAVATFPLRIVLAVLIAFDWPFSRLSPRLKNLLGCAGIATCVVAAVTWAATSHLKH